MADAGTGNVVGPAGGTLTFLGGDVTLPSLVAVPIGLGVERALVTFGAPGLEAKMTTADPALQQTMLALVTHLGLGGAVSEIEAAVRSRLRLSLADGVEDAAAAAESLGLSV